jgi:hypothetical protein
VGELREDKSAAQAAQNKPCGFLPLADG